MVQWNTYKQQAQQRGALAFEVYMVHSTVGKNTAQTPQYLPAHLAYQHNLQQLGHLLFAGPLSDETGEYMSGDGLIIYKANSLQHAIELAQQDPMHIHKVRTFTVKKWLINESCMLNTHTEQGE